VKRCFRCGEWKPRAQFYRHRMMADGRLGKCKECTRADVRANYATKRPAYAAYDRAREQELARRADKAESQTRHRARHPDRYQARTAVSNAIRAGRLRRQPCKVCGEPAQAHHADYGAALDVDWLCFRHHREHHGQAVREGG